MLANRLSAKSANRVLLLEAGQDTPPGGEPADVLDTYPVSYYNRAYTWQGLRGHWRGRDSSPEVAFRQARILGGGSSVMGMVALRGTPHDYAEWVELGAAGWGWDDVLPYFRRLETDTDMPEVRGDRDPHGHDGPVPIRRLPEAQWPPLLRGLAAYGRNSQIARIEDLNADFRDGIGALPISRFADKRASAAICYLDAATRARPNLTIATGAEVQGLVFEGTRVTGVTARLGGTTKTFGAGTVIVSAGALQSPVMLLRAGIGPADHLTACGIPVVADRPGVGANLHNHQVLYADGAPDARGAAARRAARPHDGNLALFVGDRPLPAVGHVHPLCRPDRLARARPPPVGADPDGVEAVLARPGAARPGEPGRPGRHRLRFPGRPPRPGAPRRGGAARGGMAAVARGAAAVAQRLPGRAHRPVAPVERRHPLQRSARAADRHGAGHDPGGEPADPRHHVVSRARYRDARCATMPHSTISCSTACRAARTTPAPAGWAAPTIRPPSPTLPAASSASQACAWSTPR